jgi:hypothetical protein
MIICPHKDRAADYASSFWLGSSSFSRSEGASEFMTIRASREASWTTKVRNTWTRNIQTHVPDTSCPGPKSRRTRNKDWGAPGHSRYISPHIQARPDRVRRKFGGLNRSARKNRWTRTPNLVNRSAPKSRWTRTGYTGVNLWIDAGHGYPKVAELPIMPLMFQFGCFAAARVLIEGGRHFLLLSAFDLAASNWIKAFASL